MVAGRSQDSLCEASEVHNEIWQMLLVTHYSFAARLAAQGTQCIGWKWRFKKSEDESSNTCSDGFERLHSMAIARRHTIGDLTRSLFIFFYIMKSGRCFWSHTTPLPLGSLCRARSAVCGSGASRNRWMNLAPHAAMASKDYIRWIKHGPTQLVI